jgi:type VI secretion system protein VasD
MRMAVMSNTKELSPPKRRSSSRGRFVLPLVYMSVLGACGKGGPPPKLAPPAITVVTPPVIKAKAAFTVEATSDVNPNSAGRPSPIVVRVYQLQSDALFRAADFGKLYSEDQTILGQDLLRRDDYTLTPREQRTQEVELPDQARVVCALAAFQNISTAEWFACGNLPAQVVTVAVERDRVVVTTDVPHPNNPNGDGSVTAPEH